MEQKHKKSKINTWKPKASQKFVDYDGKLYIVNFDKIFAQPKLKEYNRFMIKKESYKNQLDVITKYINFFMANYDVDNELATAYLRIKYDLDKKKLFGPDDINALNDEVYDLIFTDSICEKITQLVEDNYLDDIESDNNKQYKKSNKEYLENLEFTNKHIKILLKISFGIKIISPILFHWCSLNVIKLEKYDIRIYGFYKKLFDVFSDGCNMYNKLYAYVKTKVMDNYSHNSVMYSQREIFGYDVYSVIDQFTKHVIISENMVKYKFNEHWNPKLNKYDESITGFNKTIIKFQLGYFLKFVYPKTLNEVTNTKNAEGLSGSDKMEMNLKKRDEGITSLAEINAETTINKLMKDNDIHISDEEFNYYMEHLKISELQKDLVFQYYAEVFGGCRDEFLLPRRCIIKLIIILKKILIMEAGYDQDKQVYNKTVLPYILSGNLDGEINSRMIRNSKFTSKINNNSSYDYMVNVKYAIVDQIKQNYILQQISTILNTRFTYVVYGNDELLGKEIEYDEDDLANKIIKFMKQF